MSALSQAIKAHGQSIALRELSIPEWGIANAYIYPLSVEDRNQQVKTAQTDPYLSFVDVIVAAIRDENGKRILDHEDRLTIKKSADTRVVERVAMQILEPYLAMDKHQGN